ncbi:MAG: acetylornithine deacetylase [Lautropia sp.]
MQADSPTRAPLAGLDDDPAVRGSARPALLRETVEILRTLVGFDTTSSLSNRALIDWVQARLAALGVDAFVQHGEAGKANLFATIGPGDRGGVMLSGHSDVVPVAGETWTTPPFELTLREGRLFGRGSADMKAWIACCLAMAPRFAAARLVTPVHIALSYNEETNMHGMRMLSAHLAGAPHRPVAAVIGEPTLMQVVVANKGAAIWSVKVRGKPVHSSFRHLGVSAVEVAAEIIVFLNALQVELTAAARHDGFEFPHTSVHVGRIHGGTAHNITAKDCEFVFEVRALPGQSAAALADRVRRHCSDVLLPRMRAVSDECDIAIEEVVDSPGLDDEGNRHLANAIMPLCGCLAPRRVSFGTEGGFLHAIGVPTVICGPGDIFVAHQPDEYVETAQLDRCLEMLEALAGKLVDGGWPGA